jgi:hypothetical protein
MGAQQGATIRLHGIGQLYREMTEDRIAAELTRGDELYDIAVSIELERLSAEQEQPGTV